MRPSWVLTLVALLMCCGCTHHLAFLEESHFALKAQFKAQSASPYEIDLGYRRGMTALIPLQSAGDETEEGVETERVAAQALEDGSAKTVLHIQHDPDELMSLYSVFKANIGFNDPVRVCHFLATGIAAVVLLSDENAINALRADVGLCDSENKGAEQ